MSIAPSPRRENLPVYVDGLFDPGPCVCSSRGLERFDADASWTWRISHQYLDHLVHFLKPILN